MDLFDKVSKMYSDYEKIYNYYKIVENTKNIEDLKKIYEYVKNVSCDFYYGNIDLYYDLVKICLNKSEALFFNDYLLPISFNIDKVKVINSSFNEYEIIDYVVNEVRKHLLRRKFGNNYCVSNVSYDFANYCYIASNKIKEMFDFLGVTCYVVDIWPGYKKDLKLFNGSGYHYFNIIFINNKYFLVDITYKQFFKVGLTNIERIGLMNYPITKAGYFMMNSGSDIASKLLSDGYIELNSEIFKTYMDAFTISFRNGLYYEETNDYSYTTSYSVKDYENFLTGQDNQVNHEGIDNLGYQKRPIRNRL